MCIQNQTVQTSPGTIQCSIGVICISVMVRAYKTFCVPMDELLRAKDDLLSEGGQSLNSMFADYFGD